MQETPEERRARLKRPGAGMIFIYIILAVLGLILASLLIDDFKHRQQAAAQLIAQPTATPDIGFEAAMMCNHFYDIDITGKYSNLETNCISDEKPDTITRLAPYEFEVRGFCLVRNKETLVEWENDYTCQVKQITGGKWSVISLESTADD